MTVTLHPSETAWILLPFCSSFCIRAPGIIIVLGGTFFPQIRLIVMAGKNILAENLEWVSVGRKIVPLVDCKLTLLQQVRASCNWCGQYIKPHEKPCKNHPVSAPFTIFFTLGKIPEALWQPSAFQSLTCNDSKIFSEGWSFSVN